MPASLLMRPGPLPARGELWSSPATPPRQDNQARLVLASTLTRHEPWPARGEPQRSPEAPQHGSHWLCHEPLLAAETKGCARSHRIFIGTASRVAARGSATRPAFGYRKLDAAVAAEPPSDARADAVPSGLTLVPLCGQCGVTPGLPSSVARQDHRKMYDTEMVAGEEGEEEKEELRREDEVTDFCELSSPLHPQILGSKPLASRSPLLK